MYLINNISENEIDWDWNALPDSLISSAEEVAVTPFPCCNSK